MFFKNKKNKMRYQPTNDRRMIRILLIFSILLICFIVVLPVFADGNEGVKFKPQVGLPGFKAVAEKQVTSITLAEFIVDFYKWSIRAIAILAVVMIMVAGFQWMLAAGSAPQVSQAKDRMFSALIGLILALGAYTLLNFLNPALVRFRELSPGTIAPKAIVWCDDLPGNTKVKKIGGDLITTIDDIADNCNDKYQIYDEKDKPVKHNYCWGYKCTSLTENCTRLADKSFTCKNLVEICNGKPGKSQEDCSAYLADTYLGVYDDYVCVYDPCGKENCMLAMKMHCPDDPSTPEKETKRTSCATAGPPCYSEKRPMCHCYGTGCSRVLSLIGQVFTGGAQVLHSCWFCCTDSPNAGAIKYEICCAGDLSKVGLLANSFYHCFAWNEGRQGDTANPREYYCEDKNGKMFNFFSGGYSTWIIKPVE